MPDGGLGFCTGSAVYSSNTQTINVEEDMWWISCIILILSILPRLTLPLTFLIIPPLFPFEPFFFILYNGQYVHDLQPEQA